MTGRFLRDPLRILVKEEEVTLEGIKQFYVDVEREDYKLATLCDIYEVKPIQAKTALILILALTNTLVYTTYLCYIYRRCPSLSPLCLPILGRRYVKHCLPYSVLNTAFF